jgi:hypothetical protein
MRSLAHWTGQLTRDETYGLGAPVRGGLYLIGLFTDKKENKIFLIYEEIQNGAVAKSYMTNGLLIYRKIFAYFLIY